VATTPRLEYGQDKEELNKLQELFKKHNYSISYLGKQDVSFYDIADIDKNDFVPIHSRFCMQRKDFAAFVSVIKRLDQAEKRANELMTDWLQHNPHYPRC
jgi:uncharacterized protein YqgQ